MRIKTLKYHRENFIIKKYISVNKKKNVSACVVVIACLPLVHSYFTKFRAFVFTLSHVFVSELSSKFYMYFFQH